VTDEASRYFEDTYGGTMVNLTGVLDPDAPAKSKPLSASDNEEDGLAVHAGLNETSWMLYVRPVTATSWHDYETLPNDQDWPGYFGSPRLARADVGADLMEVWAKNTADLALRIIGGFDHRTLARLSDGKNEAIERLDGLISDHATRIEDKQRRWMLENDIK
jgi:hypothetical protein